VISAAGIRVLYKKEVAVKVKANDILIFRKTVAAESRPKTINRVKKQKGFVI
jgi:hypothetical protein